jgi:protein SCO1/2
MVMGRDILSWLLVIVGATAAAGFAALAAPDSAAGKFHSTEVTGVPWGRDFHLTGDDGKARALADFRGKVVALYFGYTHCPDICPLAMAALGQAVRGLGDNGERIQVLFVTVDPRRDRPPVLARYVRSFDDSFLGLYGDEARTAATAREFKVLVGKDHSAPVFLFDPKGRLRLVARPDVTPYSLAHDMRLLLERP